MAIANNKNVIAIAAPDKFRRTHMSYMNAEEVLPKVLVKEIQKYVDGQLLYIPRKNENSLSWGEKSGSRERLAERNQEIVNRYYSGETITNLSKIYYLSEKRIQGIIYEYESSKQNNSGGFKNE